MKRAKPWKTNAPYFRLKDEIYEVTIVPFASICGIAGFFFKVEMFHDQPANRNMKLLDIYFRKARMRKSSWLNKWRFRLGFPGFALRMYTNPPGGWSAIASWGRGVIRSTILPCIPDPWGRVWYIYRSMKYPNQNRQKSSMDHTSILPYHHISTIKINHKKSTRFSYIILPWESIMGYMRGKHFQESCEDLRDLMFLGSFNEPKKVREPLMLQKCPSRKPTIKRMLVYMGVS